MKLNFDKAFDRLIGHEGGYLSFQHKQLQYVNEPKKKHHSRIGEIFVSSLRGGNLGSYAVCLLSFFSAIKLTKVWVQGARLCSPSLRKGDVQCALHPSAQRVSVGRPGAGKEARGHLCGVREDNRSERRVGAVSEALPKGAIRNTKRRSGFSIWRGLCKLWARVSKGCFRLSPQGGQAWVSKRYVHERPANWAGQGVGQVCFVVCQLSQTGAQQ